MSIPFSGIAGRSKGITGGIAKQMKTVNLKPVKRVVFKFDPFHEKSQELRNFMFYMNKSDIAKTNPACVLKSEVVCDRSEPTVTFKLITGEDVVFKSLNLDALEMFKLYNKHITVLAPKEEPAKVIATKATKSASIGKLKKRR